MERIWTKHKKINTIPKLKVFVAMSGGVDSSVAAALLRKDGFNVVGVFLRPWSPFTKTSKRQSSLCMWKKDREDALRVAAHLDIPLSTWDFSRQYNEKVAQYMIRGYTQGITPNPDIMCNKEIKFGLFFNKAIREGADFIATGHYANIRERNDGRYILATSKDSQKDQTYFLWTLKQKHLRKTLFPVGSLTKYEVRKYAKQIGLPNHDKKDSQGVCFIGPLKMKSFLQQHIAPRSGKIYHIDGRILGMHDGACYYTIGQRHGLDIKTSDKPLFVIGKNMKKNSILVGEKKDLLSTEFRIKKLSILDNHVRFPVNVGIRIRHRAHLAKGILHKNGLVAFKKPQRAIAPGQSAVFYCKSHIVAGGIIH